jgi:hypothetical protein
MIERKPTWRTIHGRAVWKVGDCILAGRALPCSTVAIRIIVAGWLGLDRIARRNGAE